MVSREVARVTLHPQRLSLTLRLDGTQRPLHSAAHNRQAWAACVVPCISMSAHYTFVDIQQAREAWLLHAREVHEAAVCSEAVVDITTIPDHELSTLYHIKQQGRTKAG